MMSLPPDLCSVFCFPCSNILVGQLELNASPLPSPSEAGTEVGDLRSPNGGSGYLKEAHLCFTKCIFRSSSHTL